jgi:hypothetical protein
VGRRVVMNKLIYILFTVLFASRTFATVNFEDFYPQEDFSKNCGVHAAMLCLAKNHMPSDFDVLKAELDSDSDGLTTFLDLKESLTERGLVVEGFSGEIVDLKDSSSTYILQLKVKEQLHLSFVCFNEESSMFEVFDPAFGDEKQTIDSATLAHFWTGNFLQVRDSN